MMKDKNNPISLLDLIKNLPLDFLESIRSVEEKLGLSDEDKNQYEYNFNDTKLIVNLIIPTDKSVSESIVYLLERYSNTSISASEFNLCNLVEVLCSYFPLLGWQDIYNYCGPALGEIIINIDETKQKTIWLSLLTSWQVINFWDRSLVSNHYENELNQYHNKNKDSNVQNSIMNTLPVTEYVLSPIQMLSPNCYNSFAKFIIEFDLVNNSKLVHELFFEYPVSTALVKIAELMVVEFNDDLNKLNIKFQEYLNSRLSHSNYSSPIFLLKLGVLLQEKIQNHDDKYMPYAFLYLQNCLKYYKTNNLHANITTKDRRIQKLFENLRLCYTQKYPAIAAEFNVHLSSFDTKPFIETTTNNQITNEICDSNRENRDTSSTNCAITEEDINGDIIFNAYYKNEITSTQLVTFIKRISAFPTSSAEFEIFLAMMRTLFLECKHFPQYPAWELYHTGKLVGELLVSNALLVKPDLEVLLIKCMLDALRKNEKTKMFKFGLLVLQYFIPIVYISPYCLCELLGLLKLTRLFPMLESYLETIYNLIPKEYLSKSLLDAQKLKKIILPATFPFAENIIIIPSYLFLAQEQYSTNKANIKINEEVSPENIYNSYGQLHKYDNNDKTTYELSPRTTISDIENLLLESEIGKAIFVPPQRIKTKFAQICNALVKISVKRHAANLSTEVSLNYFPWLAFSLITTRVISEGNNHKLYADLCYAIQPSSFIDIVCNISYDCVNYLLRYVTTGKTIKVYRQVLKLLGSWIGLIVLAHNKSIKSKFFDIKQLLFAGYEQGTLDVILPMICACLVQQKHSKIFKKINAWNGAIYALLTNLHSAQELSMNNIFEIELLFKELHLDLNEFKNKLTGQPNLFEDFLEIRGKDQQSSSLNNFYARKAKNDQNNTIHSQENYMRCYNTSSGILKMTGRTQLLNMLAASAIINPSLSIFHKYPDLKIAVPVSMERAIKELITMLNKKSCALAIQTTVELVRKDFALEGNEEIVLKAASLMVSALSSSIVNVTGRIPLRNSIARHFIELAKSAPKATSELGNERSAKCSLEQASMVIGNENVYIASALIENIIAEQAARAVHTALAETLAARSHAIASGEKFVDTKYFDITKKWPKALPSILLNTGQITTKQFKVYSYYANIGTYKRNTNIGDPNIIYNNVSKKPKDYEQSLADESKNANAIIQGCLGQIGDAVTRMKEGVQTVMAHKNEILNNIVYEPGSIVSENSLFAVKLLSALPPDHVIFTEINLIIDIIRNNEHKDNVALCTGRRLLRSIYDAAQKGYEYAIKGNSITEISLIYLECFMLMLSKLHEHQLVHNLKEIISIWLISTTYLKPGTMPQKNQFLNYKLITKEVGARTLIVLNSASRYSLIDVYLIDNDFLSKLLTQITDSVSEEFSSEENIDYDSIFECIISTISLTLHIAYILIVDLRMITSDSFKNTINTLDKCISTIRKSQYSTTLMNASLVYHFDLMKLLQSKNLPVIIEAAYSTFKNKLTEIVSTK